LVGCGAPKVIDDADKVEVAYVVSFDDGTIFVSGTGILTIGTDDTPLYTSFGQAIVGHQVDDVVTGGILPEQMVLGTYEYALQQKLASPYLEAMGSMPEIGELVFFSNLGTGKVIAIDKEEGIDQYVIDFNPRETYEPLQYEIEILSVDKK
jgi:FKBP-type peptidyl-prolyl cis-trans isomerase 2